MGGGESRGRFPAGHPASAHPRSISFPICTSPSATETKSPPAAPGVPQPSPDSPSSRGDSAISTTAHNRPGILAPREQRQPGWQRTPSQYQADAPPDAPLGTRITATAASRVMRRRRCTRRRWLGQVVSKPKLRRDDGGGPHRDQSSRSPAETGTAALALLRATHWPGSPHPNRHRASRSRST